MTRTLRSFVAGAALLTAGASCSDSAPTASPNAFRTVSVWAPFTIHAGETVRLAGTGALLHFSGVGGDSRCPAGALIQCVWAGNARADFWMGPREADAVSFSLNSRLEPRSREIGQLQLTLRAVAPPARLGGIPPEEYVVEVLATRFQ